MEALPDDILAIIFEQFDNKTKLSVMNVCQRFASVFSNSSFLLRNFIFEVTSMNINLQLSRLPNVDLRSLIFRDLGIDTRGLYFDKDTTIKLKGCHQPASIEFSKFEILLQKYENSVENLELKNFHVKNEEKFLEIISKFKNLKSLKIEESFLLKKEEFNENLEIPQLNSVTLVENCDDFFKLLQNFKTLEKVSLSIKNCHGNFNHEALDSLLTQTPSIKHLKLEESATINFLTRPLETFRFTLHTLDVCGLNNEEESEAEMRNDFLRSQQGSLKVLNLKKLPHDYDGGEVLKFIFEEMNLESFSLNGQNLIKNGRKVVKLDKIELSHGAITAGIELLRQFSATKTILASFSWKSSQNFQSQSLFISQKHLFVQITDLSLTNTCHHPTGSDFFIDLIRNCPNLQRFSLQCGPQGVNEGFFRSTLPHLSELMEIKLMMRISINLEGHLEIFNAILVSNLRVRKVIVNEALVELARSVFAENIQIEACNYYE